MNSVAQHISPRELRTPEDLLRTLKRAEQSHSVFCQYGKATALFYSVPNGLEIDEKSLEGWLALPLQDCYSTILGIAYLSEDRIQKPIFDPFLDGCVVLGKPAEDKPLFVVSSPEVAFKISLTGYACLLTFTPNDWTKGIEPQDSGNMAHVVKSWSGAGYAHIYAPVGCDVALTYRLWLKELDITVIEMIAPITQYLATPALKAELAELVDSIEPNEWNEPLPLREVQSAPPQYPLNAFPPVARDAIKAIAYHVQAPDGLAGQCVLGTLAYISQIHVNAPTMHSPHGMPCSLFILTEGASGDRKSACHNLADKLIKEREKIKLIEYQEASAVFNDGIAACTNKKQASDFLADNPLPPNPKSIFSDATIEPIAGAFISGDIKNGAWSSDEGAQFFAGSTMKSDTAKSALGALTRVFDQGMFERTRAKSNSEAGGTAFDIRLMVNLLGQREVLHTALNDQVLRGQGFLPRFIFAAPQSLAGTRLNTIEKLSEQSYADPRLKQFWKHYGALLPDPSDPISVNHYQDIEGKPRPVLQLTESARNIWLWFYNETESGQAKGGVYESIQPFAGRAGELALRVATVFAFFEHKTEIDPIAMQGACDLVKYSLSEWLRYSDIAAVDNDTLTAEKIERWLIHEIRSKGLTAMPLREAYRLAPVRAARNKAPFIAAIKPLIDADRARLEIREGAECIAINPSLLT